VDPEAEPKSRLHEPARPFHPAEGNFVHGGRLRGPHPSWGSLVALILMIGVTVVAVDGRARAHENIEIAGCRHDLTIATDYAEDQLGLVSHYLQPPLASSGRVQRLRLADLMSARAGEVLPRIQRAERTCRRVTLKPWHFSQVAQHSADTAYAAALLTLVQTITAQGIAPFSDDGNIQRLRQAAGVT
jgi:hypothetical protein